jgi:hypothetical protein
MKIEGSNIRQYMLWKNLFELALVPISTIANYAVYFTVKAVSLHHICILVCLTGREF